MPPGEQSAFSNNLQRKMTFGPGGENLRVRKTPIVAGFGDGSESSRSILTEENLNNAFEN